MATSSLDAWSRDAAVQSSTRLVSQLRKRLLGYRGINAEADQVLITAGAQNAMYMMGCLNAYMGKSVVVEDPCYPEARNAFKLAGNPVLSVPVDQQGLVISKIPENIGLVYTTPSHQFPTTVTMSHERRLALHDRAERDNFLIYEDDYEAEMNFARRKEPPIRSIEPSARTVYVGSLSKSFAHGAATSSLTWQYLTGY